MIKVIGWCKSDNNKYGIPYGRLVTRLIENSECVVPRAEESDDLDMLVKIDKATLLTMKFIKDPETKEWVRKDEVDQAHQVPQVKPTMESMMATLIGRFDSMEG